MNSNNTTAFVHAQRYGLVNSQKRVTVDPYKQLRKKEK